MAWLVLIWFYSALYREEKMTPLQRIKAFNKIIEANYQAASEPEFEKANGDWRSFVPKNIIAIWDELNIAARCAVIECCKHAADKPIK